MRKKALKVLFLIGTKQSIDEMQRIKEGLPYRGMLAVLSIRRSGGLALLWMEEVNLHIQTFTQNHMDALILNEPNTPWKLTSFYGWPEEQRKNESWHLAPIMAPPLSTLSSLVVSWRLQRNFEIRRETRGTTRTLESHASISGNIITLWFGGLGFWREYVYME